MKRKFKILLLLIIVTIQTITNVPVNATEYQNDASKRLVKVIQPSHSSTGMQVVAANNYTGVLKEDGTVWVWGYNCFGKLGDGTTDTRTKPVQVTGLTGVKAVAAGFDHMAALKKNVRYGPGEETLRDSWVMEQQPIKQARYRLKV